MRFTRFWGKPQNALWADPLLIPIVGLQNRGIRPMGCDEDLKDVHERKGAVKNTHSLGGSAPPILLGVLWSGKAGNRGQ